MGKKIKQHKTDRRKSGFTLVEVMAGLLVFSLIVSSSAGIFIAIQQSWIKQRDSVDLIQNNRWAMEFIIHELMQGGGAQVTGGGTRINFDPYPGFMQPVWYWRGNSASDLTGLGDSTFLYRGVGGTILQAYLQRQQLANFVADNPSGNDIFAVNSGLVTIELTVNKAGRNYTLRSRVRTRN
jgi:prepilin-type N-terminal cleavage/methylation domain-containing protein